MEISRELLLRAAASAGISPDSAAALWAELAAESPAPPAAAATAPAAGAPKSNFNATNVAYYFGGFLIIGAMTFLMAEGWALMGGAFILIMSLIYAAILGWVGYRLYAKPETRTPGGVLVTAAVCMMPLAVYGFEATFHLWQDGNPGKYSGFYALVHGSWIWMELATIAASAAALRFVRFPLLTLPAAFALWFLSMDFTSALYGPDRYWEKAPWVALYFGIGMLAVSIYVDRRTKEDFAFWGYLYGTIALYGGAGALLWDTPFHRFLFLLLSLASIGLSIVLGRRVLLVFGTLGVYGYLSWLAFGVFDLSIYFPFVLTIFGLGIVAAGIWYQRNEARIRERALAIVPERLVAMLPASRA